MACSSGCACGACAGATVDTPGAKVNLPGLPVIVYRVGAHDDFRDTMRARLSSADFPALAALTTRDESDFSLALGDAFSVMADVLTFYQERIANESYLRTATQRRSVRELGALIGYQLGPGVSAATALAFQLESAPGAVDQAALPVTIPAGTRAQSIPGPSETAQTFETDADLVAQVDWNAMPAQQSVPVPIAAGQTIEIFVDGAHNRLEAGDPILLVDQERLKAKTTSARWQVVYPEVVEPDRARDVTRLCWTDPLDSQWNDSSTSKRGVRAYVLRQRVGLFGNQAPDPSLLIRKGDDPINANFNAEKEWAGLVLASNVAALDLDNLYSKVVKKSWFVVLDGDAAHLYRADKVSHKTRKDYGLTGKVTRLVPDVMAGLAGVNPRTAVVLAESEELTLVERPLVHPVLGDSLALDVLAIDLQPEQALGVSGKRQRVKVGVTSEGIVFDGQPDRVAKPGESFFMLAGPTDDATKAPFDPALLPLDPSQLPAPPTLRWRLEDHRGTELIVIAAFGLLILAPPRTRDRTASELVFISDALDAVTSDAERTTVKLGTALVNCYDRSTVTVNANVVTATHGETVTEIVGSGDARQRNQQLRLKQTPLTYVPSDDDPSGRAPALDLRVNGLSWTAVPSLYGAGRRDRVYELRHDDDGGTTVRFGDGQVGARLPSGNSNVRATHRRGLGAPGNVRAGQISTLLTRPLGVRGVSNPGPGLGGQDAETLEAARRNAPLKVLTIDRVVSADDYAAFSRGFAGIGKAHALWIPAHPRGMVVTVAGAGGALLPEGGDAMKALCGALKRFGDPLLPVTVRNFSPVSFRLVASLEVKPDARFKPVRRAVERALRARFGFDARELGQPITIDEIYATIQQVRGVLAADVSQLYRLDLDPVAALNLQLDAALPAVQPDGSVGTAELLTLAPDRLDLGVMT